MTIGNKAGFANLTETLKGGDVGWLAICAIGQVVVFAGYAGALRRAIAFEGGPRIETGLSLRVVLASFALSQLFAAGGVAGLAVTYWALRRVGMDRRAAAVRLIGLSTAVYLVFGVIGWVAALLALVLNAAPLGMTLPWLVGIPLVLLAAHWFTSPDRVERWSAPGGGILRQALATGVERGMVGAAGCRRPDRRPARVPLGVPLLGRRHRQPVGGAAGPSAATRESSRSRWCTRPATWPSPCRSPSSPPAGWTRRQRSP